MTDLAPLAATVVADHSLDRFHVARVARDGRCESVASGDDARPDDLVRWASVGKLHTALLCARLVDDDRLTFDEPLADRVDVADVAAPLGAPSSWTSTVTLADLIGHTSGAADVLSDERFDALVRDDPTRSWTVDELLALARRWGPLVAGPGKRFHYSDTGFVIAGLAAERVVGRPFEAVLRSELLAPLGLDDTWVEARQALPRLVARHAVDGLDVTSFDVSFDVFGGGIVAPAADVARLLHAAATGRAVSTRSWARMTRWNRLASVRADDGPPYARYGLGVGGADVEDDPVVLVTGAWGTVAVHDPTTVTTWAAATGEATTDTHAVAERLVSAGRAR